MNSSFFENCYEAVLIVTMKDGRKKEYAWTVRTELGAEDAKNKALEEVRSEFPDFEINLKSIFKIIEDELE